MTRCQSSMSSRVSLPRFRTHGAPLSSSGFRWPRFPAFNGTISALRLPAPLPLGLLVSPVRYHAHPAASCCRSRAPARMQASRRAGVLIFQAGSPPSSRSRTWTVTGPPRFPGSPSRSFAAFPRPRTARHASPFAALPVLPLLLLKQRGRHWCFRGSIALLHCPLCTLHDGHCCTPCNTRSPAGWLAFAWWESHPLDCDARFPFSWCTSFLLLPPCQSLAWRKAVTELERFGVRQADYHSRDYSRTREVADGLNYLGCNGLIAPSARYDCTNLIIFVH